ncbi:hypothetical protein HCN44_000405 [Aphidius gifuensis]|uniref:Uncharacterized protein n=1 Tax=Aphidius gifuensis TaxID=684658 RepID=A0A834XNX1_APHGI|nr:hypothetical protein HCN44_000405 [Aphidius gifuensis]
MPGVFPNSKNIPEVLIDSKLSLLAVNVKIDLDNVITITPNGILILSFIIVDFQSLGIKGKLTYFDRNKQTRYGRITKY